MAAIALDITQSGSGDAEIHAEVGDTIGFALLSPVKNDVLAAAFAGLQGLGDVTGVALVASFEGDDLYATIVAEAGESTLMIGQFGSGDTGIGAEKGDTITFELASVVKNSVMAAANAYLQALSDCTGITFAINTAGEAS